MKVTSETKVGDKVEHEGEKGKVKEIQGEGLRRVAVIEIPVTSVKTVYVAIPPPPDVSETQTTSETEQPQTLDESAVEVYKTQVK